jgi:D-amino-acid dehydrogenase
MANVLVIGGGIIGLSSAYYLQQSGHKVTIVDKTDISDNCSYGNAGYVCPSHFIPLATPGIVKQGLKWMFNSTSPFYVQPRLSSSLVSWGLKFMKSAKPEKVEAAAIPLRDISLLSQSAYEEWIRDNGFDFAYEKKGLLEIFQTAEKEAHAKHTVEKAHQLGLRDTILLSAEELFALEPQVKINATGAIWFKCDAHLYPNKVMKQLIDHLKNSGVLFQTNEEVKAISKANGKISQVITDKNTYETDMIVIAAGAWSREIAKMIGIKIPLVGGRGYSVTFEDSPYKINYPAVLMESRVALTPMDGNKIRFGGTMEITSTKTAPRMKRVIGLLNGVKRFYPQFDPPVPPIEKVWYGYRPCSADGLPYIGKVKQFKNLVMATGHSMLGLSLGAGTGKLVSEIINEQPISMDIAPFNPGRFGG